MIQYRGRYAPSPACRLRRNGGRDAANRRGLPAPGRCTVKKGLFCFCLLLLLSACAGGSAASPSPEASGAPAAESPSASASARPAWGAAQFGFTKTDDKTGETVMTASYLLPKITNQPSTAAWTAINDYYSAEGEALTKNAEEMAGWAYDDYETSKTMKYDYQPYTDEQTYDATLVTDSMASILRTHYIYSGGAYGDTFLFSDTFNLSTGQKLKLDDLFSVASDVYGPRVLAEVKALAARESDGGTPRYDPDKLESAFDPNCFYLTGDALVIYYQTYALGPRALGMPQFSIPKDKLEDILIPW